MASMAKVSLIGNLGRDAEMKYTPQGNPLLEFSIAVNDPSRGRAGGNASEKTDWYRVTLWGKQAESLKTYLTRGKQVFVDGKLRIREYIDRDGKNRYSLEVNAQTIQLLGGRPGESAETQAPPEELRGPDDGVQDEDIPF